MTVQIQSAKSVAFYDDRLPRHALQLERWPSINGRDNLQVEVLAGAFLSSLP